MNESAAASGSVVLAGGGTAGHTSPLIATGLELRRLSPRVTLTALGTARGLETTVVPAAGLELELIPPVPMPRRLGKDLALLGPRLFEAVTATARLLRRTQADVVLGFGGYVSTPAYLAARRLGLPIVIHEQNVLPGLANRLAARLTSHVYTSFPQTSLPHALCIGLPMRRAITALDRAALEREARIGFELHPEFPTLLVSGGSQGAMRINTAVAGAWPDLLARGIQVLHVLGPKNLTPGIVRSLDERTGAVYQPVAYVDQMERAYAAANLMLARSGASTVLETAAVGLPAVFVPYPHGNGEQARNAELIVKAGGCIMLADSDCTSAWVADEIPALFAHPDRLAGMRNALAGVARLDAATVLASRVLEVIR
jgi:UDP-N-acetylglucosamine--N-acetylmuramyl-(pentapeptide) pyrophosphoryl-undecaprenol N-acetylglucosamine transferase